MLNILFLAIGLVVLVIGGDLLVRGAVAIAEKLSVPPLIIGLTIVSMGTSAPELVISVQAALAGSGGLAIGNVVGSNIANVLLVLGVPALITATCCGEAGLGRCMNIMIAITVVFMLMLAKGSLGMIDGLVLLGLLGLFLWDQYNSARKSKLEEKPDYHDDVGSLPSNMLISSALLLVGLILLPLGAWLTVSSAQEIAQQLGVPDTIIGLTIVAIGTSLPELAASLMAVIRGNSNIAIGNVIGSNVFNIAAIMGFTSVIADIKVDDVIIHFDMWVMLATTIWLAWLASYKGTISRLTGILMTSTYIIYLGVAFIK